jgi:DNA-binding NarL/FixJ family response regulator
MTSKPRVLLVEDDRDVRESLRYLLTGSPRVELAAVFESAEPALEAIKGGLRPDVGLFDLGLPGMTGQELIRRVREIVPGLDIVVLTIFDDRENVFDALRAGASGYLLKDTPTDQLIEAIVQIADGGSSMTPSIARRVIAQLWERPSAASPLTPREVDVLRLLVKGATYDLIGQGLGISTGTVQAHIKAIYRKLEVSTKAEAAAEAFRRGIVS